MEISASFDALANGSLAQDEDLILAATPICLIQSKGR